MKATLRRLLSDAQDNVRRGMAQFRGGLPKQKTPAGMITFLPLFIAIAAAGCSRQADQSNRTFFRTEQGLQTHGRKTWFDHLVEVDPGGIHTTVAASYNESTPEKIAILPFSDRGSANYVIDKVALSKRGPEEQADWAWTDANPFRPAITGYLAQREFLVANLIQVDAV